MGDTSAACTTKQVTGRCVTDLLIPHCSRRLSPSCDGDKNIQLVYLRRSPLQENNLLISQVLHGTNFISHRFCSDSFICYWFCSVVLFL